MNKGENGISGLWNWKKKSFLSLYIGDMQKKKYASFVLTISQIKF